MILLIVLFICLEYLYLYIPHMMQNLSFPGQKENRAEALLTMVHVTVPFIE